MSHTVPKWASQTISVELPAIREAGEGKSVDFKEAFPDQAHRLGKEIAAMASSGGGRIFIGIDDNGSLRGINASTGEDRDDLAERAHAICRTVKPVPDVSIHFAVECQLTVLVIEIPRQDHPVFYYEYRPYVRDERRARPAEPNEVVELVWAHPSSEHKKELERLEQQQLQRMIDNSREQDQLSADQTRRFHETIELMRRRMIR